VGKEVIDKNCRWDSKLYEVISLHTSFLYFYIYVICWCSVLLTRYYSTALLQCMMNIIRECVLLVQMVFAHKSLELFQLQSGRSLSDLSGGYQQILFNSVKVLPQTLKKMSNFYGALLFIIYCNKLPCLLHIKTLNLECLVTWNLWAF